MIFALFAFLALYTWNARTGYLDALAEHSGLEVTGYLLRPGIWIKDEISGYWQRYFALVGVAEENSRLRDEMRKAEQYLAVAREDQAELFRLRALVGFTPPDQWQCLGTRVMAGRFGPAAALESVMINRGFATGAAPGTPFVTHQGLAGKVFRASPHSATVLLLTDRAFRVAVISQKNRVPGVLSGGGPRANLEVRYMAPSMPVETGEMLVTSGLDGDFPKGIPVARVIHAEPGNESLFQQVQAAPLVQLDTVEEALLLLPPASFSGKKAGRPGMVEAADASLRPGGGKGKGNATAPGPGQNPSPDSGQSRLQTLPRRPGSR